MAAFDGLAVAVHETRHEPATLVQVSSRGAMDWNDVRVFLAVAREGSMRASLRPGAEYRYLPSRCQRGFSPPRA